MSRVRRKISSPTLGAALGLLVAAGGCAVDQDKEVAQYRRELDASSPAAPAYDGDTALSLVDALALANRGNERLGLSGEDYVQALIQKNRAFAGFLPTLSFRPSYTLQQSSDLGSTAVGTTTGGDAGAGTGTGGTGTGTGGTGTGTGGSATGGTGTLGNSASLTTAGFRRFNNDVSYQLQAPVVGSINLFRGGGDLATLRSVEATIEQRRQLLLDTQATVLLNVAQTYYAVLRAERSVDVLKNTLNVQQARLRDVQQQFNNGLATRLAVAQSRAQVDATRATLVLADGDVKNGRSTLAFLVNAGLVRGPLSDGFRAPVAVPDVTEFEREAERSRQDFLAAINAATAARENVTAAVAQYYPSVALNVQAFAYREFYSDASKWSAILSVNVPIFSAGLIEADVREAWSRYRQALLNESFVRRQAINDVRVAYQNVQTSDARVTALRDQVRAAQESYQQSQDAFTSNLAINLDVLTSQDQLLTAQLDLAAAEYDRTVYYLDLMRSTGRLTVNQVISTIASPEPATVPTTREDELKPNVR